MNYLTQINEFYKIADNEKLNCTEKAMYFELLRFSNSLMWKNPFNLTFNRLADMLQIKDRRTIRKLKNRLSEIGLIEFTPPKYASGMAGTWYIKSLGD